MLGFKAYHFDLSSTCRKILPCFLFLLFILSYCALYHPASLDYFKSLGYSFPALLFILSSWSLFTVSVFLVLPQMLLSSLLL